MNFLHNVVALLVFRASALRMLAARQAMVRATVCLGAGFLAFALVRHSVYAELEGYPPAASLAGILASFLRLHLIQALVFLLLVYVPILLCLSNAIAAEGPGLIFSREEYRVHLAVLFPLWGVLLLVVSPLQWLVPHFVVLGIVGISIGLLVLIFLLLVYTVWAVRVLDCLPTVASLGAVTLSAASLPIFYLLANSFHLLVLFVVAPLLFLVVGRLCSALATLRSSRARLQYLRYLAVSPQDAKVHNQLGLLFMEEENFDTAQEHLEKAIEIDPGNPEFHYSLGRLFEAKGMWSEALARYEGACRQGAEHVSGEIFREVGKAYLHTGNFDKAIEFLEFHLSTRISDVEGRYWLAEALGKSGRHEEMRLQLNAVLKADHSKAGSHRHWATRKWINRARMLLRSSSEQSASGFLQTRA